MYNIAEEFVSVDVEFSFFIDKSVCKFWRVLFFVFSAPDKNNVFICIVKVIGRSK